MFEYKKCKIFKTTGAASSQQLEKYESPYQTATAITIIITRFSFHGYYRGQRRRTLRVNKF